MLSGINQWAFPDDLPAVECISRVKALGFQSFEVCVGADGPTRLDAADRDIEAIRAHAEREGIVLHSVASGEGWKNAMTSLDAGERARAIEVTKRSLDIAGLLGAKALLVVPGTVSEKTPYDRAVENALDCLAELAPHAEARKVAIAIENVWNKFLLSPTEMRDFIDQCDSPYIGAYVDVGNMLAYGYPEQWLRILGPRVKAVHMKDFRCSVGTLGGFVMLMEGDVNWPAVMAALREIDYQGALTGEYWTYEHSRDAMLQHVKTGLDHIMAL